MIKPKINGIEGNARFQTVEHIYPVGWEWRLDFGEFYISKDYLYKSRQECKRAFYRWVKKQGLKIKSIND